jgi:hypothetical protein
MQAGAPMSEAAAAQWSQKHGWRVGCNFIPSTAINQLEMWQAETYDPETIDRELCWAEDIGLNTVRVYLHNLPWEQDAQGFKERIDGFLTICDRHGIKVMFVLFDDCWYGNAQPGPQPPPDPGLHNSYWLQCPRYAEVMDESVHPRLEAYTKDILRSFADDERVLMWDLYNEPANNHFPGEIFPLVRKVFRWARQANPSQPLTMGVWRYGPERVELNDFQLANSDVVTFHNYGKYEDMKKDIAKYKSFDRPVICTEYLARGFKSKFQTHLPMMKAEGVGAINWGLVSGKTQTIFPWDAPLNGPQPDPWHHDIFHKDGTPYDPEETRLIKSLTGR